MYSSRCVSVQLFLSWVLISTFGSASSQELKATLLTDSKSLSQAQILLSSRAETQCLVTILTDTLGDSRTFVNDVKGQVVVHKDFSFTMTDKRAVYSPNPGYDNKLPVDIEGNRLLLILERPGDQIILDQTGTGRPVIGIGSRIRFDLHNWVPFLDGRYRGVYRTRFPGHKNCLITRPPRRTIAGSREAIDTQSAAASIPRCIAG